jgi:hypothetical protein
MTIEICKQGCEISNYLPILGTIFQKPPHQNQDFTNPNLGRLKLQCGKRNLMEKQKVTTEVELKRQFGGYLRRKWQFKRALTNWFI